MSITSEVLRYVRYVMFVTLCICPPYNHFMTYKTSKNVVILLHKDDSDLTFMCKTQQYSE